MATWKTLFPSQSNHCGPHARSGHRIVIDDNSNIYCYGGYNPVNPAAQQAWLPTSEFPMFRELWKYNVFSKRWQNLPTSGTKPEESASYACVLLGHRLLVLGGTGYPFAQVRSNKLYCCDLKSHEWSVWPCTGNLPRKVYGHSLTRVDNHLYLFGGTVGFSYLNDMYRLDLNTRKWELLCKGSTPDSCPSPRYRHEVAAHDGKLYVLGGGTSVTSEPLTTMWEFDIAETKWTRVDTVSNQGFPSPRKCHGCVQIGPDVYISGGIGNDNQTCFNDIWKIHLPDRTWSKLPLNLPAKVYFHAMAASSDGGTIYTFGGVKGASGPNAVEDRTRELHQMNLASKSLAERSWEAMSLFFPHLSRQQPHKLARVGVPHGYLSRLDRSQQETQPVAESVAIASAS